MKTPDKIETDRACLMLMAISAMVGHNPDAEAQIAALACRIFELATPDLSDQNRAALFWGEE